MDTATNGPSWMTHTGHGFSLVLRGGILELTLQRLDEGAEGPSFTEILAAATGFPVEIASPSVVAEAIQRGPGRPPIGVGRVEFPEDREGWLTTISPNRMAAYVIPGAATPVRSGDPPPPTEVDAETLRAELRALGIFEGVKDELLDTFSPKGPASEIFMIAEGRRPVPAVNSSVEIAFDTASIAIPVPRADGSVDYHAATTAPSVAIGDILVRKIPPVEGIPGCDVLGNPISPRAPMDEPLARIAGAGTSARTEVLAATRAGRPVLKNGKVEVLPIFEVKGDVSYTVGNIRFNGDVLVHGDVQAGFRIDAEGTVTVRGMIDRASITAGDDIMASGIVGDANSSIEAGRNMRLQYARFAKISVEGELVVNRELLDCVTTAQRVQTSPSGRIVGGEVTAREQIIVGSLGSPQVRSTDVTVLSHHGKNPPVVRVSGITAPGTVIRVGYSLMKVVDPFSNSSYWDGRGEMIRLGTTSPAPDGAKPYMAKSEEEERAQQALAS